MWHDVRPPASNHQHGQKPAWVHVLEDMLLLSIVTASCATAVAFILTALWP